MFTQNDTTEQQAGAVAIMEDRQVSAQTNRGMGAFDPGVFTDAQRVCNALSKSTLVPKEFQGNLPNCLIAYDMASRLGANPLMVMQNLYVVHGKPSWSGSFICGMINSCGRFKPLKFRIEGEGDDRSCVAWTTEKGSDEKLESAPVSIAMAKAEGWYGKNGSKWKTMPEVMLRYRAATFFGRVYAPELLLGMQTAEEVEDVYSSGSDRRVEIPTGKVGRSVLDEQPEQEEVSSSVSEPEAKEDQKPEAEPAKEDTKPKAKQSSQSDIGKFVNLLDDNNIAWPDFVDWAEAEYELKIEKNSDIPAALIKQALKDFSPLVASVQGFLASKTGGEL